MVYAGLSFGRFDDPAFGVIWLVWAVLWALFWVVLGLGRESLSRFTGAVALVAGILTAAIPAFLLLTGVWVEYTTDLGDRHRGRHGGHPAARSTRGCAAHPSRRPGERRSGAGGAGHVDRRAGTPVAHRDGGPRVHRDQPAPAR